MTTEQSWVPVPRGSDFTLANLPYGVAGGRAHVAIGDHALDLAGAAAAGLLDTNAAPGMFEGPLNRFLGLGPPVWRAVRERVRLLLSDDCAELRDHPRRDELVVDRGGLDLQVPVAVGDYVDGYAGLHHATNLGRILRPGGEPLNPNWRHLPVMYHGRAGTIVPSGTPVVRPCGQILTAGSAGSASSAGTTAPAPALRPTAQLDIELELGAIVGVGNERGQPIPVGAAAEHIFGFVLVNDWSARDIQAFEYQPLGPFLGKSFATSVSPWIVPFDALRPHLVAGLAGEQQPAPLDYLRGDPAVPDLSFTVELTTEAMRSVGAEPYRVSDVSLSGSLYWTPAQQLAHLTVNGASTRPGDLVASGTLSGPDHRTQAGSLIERSWRGAEPMELPSGEQRSFLADGDEVTMRGWAGDGAGRVGFGALTGTVAPSRSF